jgi:hypothetical protein
MKKENKLALVFGYLALASGSIWFGAYFARLLTTYQMFEAIDLSLKSFINSNNLPAIIQTTYPLVLLTFITYLILILSFTFYLMISKIRLKENGWLLIIAMIIYLTLPLESVLLWIDYKLITLFFNEQFASAEILKLIRDRISVLSSFPIILLLSYLSIPYFLVFKPFTISSRDEN